MPTNVTSVSQCLNTPREVILTKANFKEHCVRTDHTIVGEQIRPTATGMFLIKPDF